MADDRWPARIGKPSNPGHRPSVIGHRSSAIPMPTFEGDFSPPPGRFAVVAARFNATVTASLLAGCRDALARHGVGDDRVDVAWVPGSFEIPVVARKLADSGRYAAVICLGCVI